MKKFANYKNGRLTVNTYRLPDALVTDVAYILASVRAESDEILTASIDTEHDEMAISGLIGD